MAKRKAVKKQKRAVTEVDDSGDFLDGSDLNDMRDDLGSIISVIETVVTAIVEHNDQSPAWVLQQYGLEPLRKIKEKLEKRK